MIRRLAVITCWLLAGHTVWLAIFWGLLQVPESSVWTLALSIVLALCLIALAASLSAGAAMAWNVWRPALPSGVPESTGAARASMRAAP